MPRRLETEMKLGGMIYEYRMSQSTARGTKRLFLRWRRKYAMKLRSLGKMHKCKLYTCAHLRDFCFFLVMRLIELTIFGYTRSSRAQQPLINVAIFHLVAQRKKKKKKFTCILVGNVYAAVS